MDADLKSAEHEFSGTKLALVEAAFETLRKRGYAGSSAREIARTGNLNQALVFYHFSSVRNLLLAVLDHVSDLRIASHASRVEAAESVPELARLAREIYREDVERGYTTVLNEMLAAAASDSDLGSEVMARVEPWIRLVEQRARDLLDGSVLSELVSPRDLAFGLVALYLGVDMLSQLDGDQTRAEGLFDLGVRLAAIAGGMLEAGTGVTHHES
jgi:AcrR family transcriptional regulator